MQDQIDTHVSDIKAALENGGYSNKNLISETPSGEITNPIIIKNEELPDIVAEIGKKIVTDINVLKIPCEAVTDLKEGEAIASKLFRMLTIIKKMKILSGSGMSANQLGINKRVCVINVKEPIYLINPIIVNPEGECNYFEGCLSFPTKGVKTKRYTTFSVKADNLENELYFDVSDLVKTNELYSDDVFEAMTIQHEIDHLNGITMFDRKLKPILSNKIYGRNDKVTISNDIEEKVIKYKNFDIYKNNGFHIL
jgi:peptide deformylase